MPRSLDRRIARLQREGYHVVKRDRVQYLGLNKVVPDEVREVCPDAVGAEKRVMVYSLANELAKNGILFNEEPRPEPYGTLIRATLCIIIPKQKQEETNADAGADQSS